MATEIWIARWTFLNDTGIELHAHDVVTKRIPVRFLLNEGIAYHRAIRDVFKNPNNVTFLKTLKVDKETGLKKFYITYTKFLSCTNE